MLRVKFIENVITGYQMFCLRNNVLAIFYRTQCEVLFQGSFANNST